MYDTSEDEIDKCFTDLEEKPLVHNSTPMKEGNYGGWCTMNVCARLVTT